MTRIRCPTSSANLVDVAPQATSQPEAGPSNAPSNAPASPNIPPHRHMSRFRPKSRPDANLGGGDHGHAKRPRSEGVNADKKKDIEMAKKKDNLKEHINTKRQEVKRRRSLPFVFVGNLIPTVTREILKDLFSPCGTVLRIQIRCTQGAATVIGQPVDDYYKRPGRNLQHATIEFKERSAVHEALQLNGTILDGQTLVVSVSPADLPEIRAIAADHIQDMRRRRAGIPAPEIKPGGTEIFGDQIGILGYSFPKSLI